MKNKRLSIIIPFYNVEQYIAQCLDSVYAQDIPEDEYEVICVDDCSPDNSIVIVEEYAKKHSNLILVRNECNRKLGGARNAGMEIATGNYVWYIDSDDLIVSNSFSKLLLLVENDDLDVLHFNYLEYPKEKPIKRGLNNTSVKRGEELFFSSEFIWYHDFVTAWRKLYRRQFLIDNKISFAEHIMFEDNDYAIEVFANAKRVKHISYVAYLYRNNPESITRVKYSSAHISYWLDLAKRLIILKGRFIMECKDNRLIILLTDFIKHTISNVIREYKLLDADEKKSSLRLMRSNIDKEFKPYISKMNYFKLKFGLL